MARAGLASLAEHLVLESHTHLRSPSDALTRSLGSHDRQAQRRVRAHARRWRRGLHRSSAGLPHTEVEVAERLTSVKATARESNPCSLVHEQVHPLQRQPREALEGHGAPHRRGAGVLTGVCGTHARVLRVLRDPAARLYVVTSGVVLSLWRSPLDTSALEQTLRRRTTTRTPSTLLPLAHYPQLSVRQHDERSNLSLFLSLACPGRWRRPRSASRRSTSRCTRTCTAARALCSSTAWRSRSRRSGRATPGCRSSCRRSNSACVAHCARDRNERSSLHLLTHSTVLSLPTAH